MIYMCEARELYTGQMSNIGVDLAAAAGSFVDVKSKNAFELCFGARVVAFPMFWIFSKHFKPDVPFVKLI